jgi:hypothetical protein
MTHLFCASGLEWPHTGPDCTAMNKVPHAAHIRHLYWETATTERFSCVLYCEQNVTSRSTTERAHLQVEYLGNTQGETM